VRKENLFSNVIGLLLATRPGASNIQVTLKDVTYRDTAGKHGALPDCIKVP
jgi:hypothetical protein